MPRDKKLIESELLVVRCQRGDRAAFAPLVQLWERSLFYYLRRLVMHEADAWELLQETWLSVFRSFKSLRDPATFPAFIYRTARNAAITRLRRPEFFQAESDPGRITNDPTTDPIAEFDNAEQVHRALEQLPLPQREVLTLFFLRELSLEEIAVLLGIPTGTVKSRLHYARNTIRQILTQGEPHDRPIRPIPPATPGRPADLPGTPRGLPEGA